MHGDMNVCFGGSFMIMNIKKLFIVLLVAGLFVSCNSSSGSDDDNSSVPFVSSMTPGDLSTGIAVNSNITAVFSTEMDPASVNAATFTLNNGSSNIAGVVTYTGSTASFNPADNLANNTTYTVTIAQQAKSIAGRGMDSSKVWKFTTGFFADNVAPTVSSTAPADLEKSILTDGNISVVFSEAMDALSITATTFSVNDGSANIDGVVTCLDKVATFNPATDLARNKTYTATITTGALDLAGNALATSVSWSFVTPLGPSRVVLGTAGNFVILSKAGVDTIPTSSITGDIGVSPAAASYITHFTLVLNSANTFSESGQVTGKVYASDYALATPAMLGVAIADMTTANSDAADRLSPDFTNLDSGNIGGLTMVPGLYHWSTGVTVSSDVTLDGGPNDIWIFQVTGVLYMGSDVKVILTGGAQAKNVFWKVNSATLNTGAHLEGILLANTAISLATGSSMNGRLFTNTAVTLDSSTVKQPAP